MLIFIHTSYFDVFYMHFPVALEYVDPNVKYPSGWKNLKGEIAQGRTPIQETWRAMEDLVDIGLVRSIGISNFQGSLIMDLLRYARIRPAMLQVEIHPYLVQEGLVSLCQSENIVVTAYSSYVSCLSYPSWQLDIFTQIRTIIFYHPWMAESHRFPKTL